MLHAHRCGCGPSIILKPRLGGCVDHTIDPKLKHADFICGTSSNLWSGKVASFASIACYHVNLKTDTLPGHTGKKFPTYTLRLGNVFLSDMINTCPTHGHSSSSEALFLLCGIKAPPPNFEDSSWYVSGTCAFFTGLVIRNLSNTSVLSHTSTNH